MKYISSLSNILKRNSTEKKTIKNFIPIKIRIKIHGYLNSDKSIRIYFGNKSGFIDFKNDKIKGLIPVYYWDDTPNFGDLIGPYLISKITDSPVLNIKNLHYPGIMAVGSIIQMLNRKKMVIWGSGLIRALTDDQMKTLKDYNPQVLSVRGYNTAKQLSEAGIKVPDESMYGDPALILPLFYNPTISVSRKIGICPHYIHKPYFLNNIIDEDKFDIIDVQNDMETVVDLISSSTACISTSLHGLIVAQAYGIPWVWLEVYDDNLSGEDFKFKDFFSTLDESQVSHVRVSLDEIKNLNYINIAEKASLPNKLYDENLILDALKSYLN